MNIFPIEAELVIGFVFAAIVIIVVAIATRGLLIL